MKKMCFCVILPALFLIMLLSFSSVGVAQVGVWARKADMPGGSRDGQSNSVVDGKIYAIGGLSGGPLSIVEEYDPLTDTWTRKADMPTPRYQVQTEAVNGKIYAIGGWDVLNPPNSVIYSTVEEYDPKTDIWTAKADMLVPRAEFCTGVVNGKIYAISGGNYEETGYWGIIPTVEEYDPTTDTWTEKADILTPRDWPSASVANGKIYVFGDWHDKSVVEEYDPATDSWSRKTDMPTPRMVSAACTVGGKIYVIGGTQIGPPDSGIPTVEIYDPATDTWEAGIDMPGPRWAFDVSVVNGRIYAIAGYDGSLLRTVEEFDTGLGIQVDAISPQEAPVTGGESIAILGSRFQPGMMVTIGGNPVADLSITETLITGIIPPGSEGEQDILIFVPDLDEFVSVGKFFYNPSSGIVVTGITPINGKQAGGGMGSITGSGFVSSALVTIGGTPATDVGVTPTLITFTVPPGNAGEKDVVVTNPDGQRGILRAGYTYNPFPVIKRIRPASGGPLAGRTAITITGEHFMDGVVVSIGEKRVPTLDFFSPTELRLKTPPEEAGPKTVTVINPDEQKAVKEAGFTYNPAPTITSIKPDAGSMEGGTVITITGTGFIGPDVLIGGAEARGAGSSSTKIRAETPPSDAGVKNVVVRNRDGQRATLEDAFTYNPAPAITKVIPDNGRLAGDTEIIIQGTGFLPGAKVFFSTDTGTLMTAPSAQVMSGNIITAITPLGKPGPKDVVVRNTDEQRVILTDGFTYNPLPTITHITPNNGGSSGGTKIIIEGTGFLQGVRVAVGGNAGIAQWQDEETIQVVTPSNPPGIWDVRLLNPDTQEVTAKRAFITVGEIVYNFPNPFRASRGTTFRYMTRHQVQYMTIKIFNLSGSPVDALETTGSNEVKWLNPRVHIGLYVYLVEAELENGERRQFRSMLEVQK